MTNKVKKQIKVDGKIAKLAVFRGMELHGYYITASGDLYSVILHHFTRKKYNKNFDYTSPYKFTNYRGNKGYITYKISLLNKDKDTAKYLLGKNKKSLMTVSHIIVMNTWRPLTKYTYNLGFTPTQFKKTPKCIQNILMDTVYVNHIDHNRHNNHVKNLEWSTPKHNARAAQKFYKGKKKKKK